MKVINHNTPSLLYEMAETLGNEPHESWRCIYFKFSETPERHNHELYANFIVTPIINMLAGINGLIYIFDDGDILILFQGALRPLAVKLSSHFGDIDPDSAVSSTGNNLFRAFDLSKHWEEFYELCETKYYKKLVQIEAARKRLHPHFHHAGSFVHKPA